MREVLEPVYAAMALDWDPETAGSIADELGGDVALEDVATALRAELATRFELTPAPGALLDAAVAHAATLEPRFAVGTPPRGRSAAPPSTTAAGPKLALEREAPTRARDRAGGGCR